MNELQKKVAEMLGKRTIPQSFSRAVVDQNGLNDQSDEASIEEAVEKFTGFYRTHIQPEVDRRVDGAVKTYREKHGLDENGNPIDPEKQKQQKQQQQQQQQQPTGGSSGKDQDGPKPGEGLSDEMKQFLENQTKIIGELQKQVQDLSKGQKHQTLQEKAKGLFDNSDKLKNLKPTVKERWLKRLDFESETPIEDQVKELEDEADEVFSGAREQFVNEDEHYQPRMPDTKKPEDYLKIMNGETEEGNEQPGVSKVEFPK